VLIDEAQSIRCDTRDKPPAQQLLIPETEIIARCMTHAGNVVPTCFLQTIAFASGTGSNAVTLARYQQSALFVGREHGPGPDDLTKMTMRGHALDHVEMDRLDA
jgi:hypothetical protein